MLSYRSSPESFADEVLGSRWWSRQRSVAGLVAKHRRTAVKSANGVGKTYLAADLALWFLYTHRPSIVLTTAPTWRQVRHLLWEEIRKRMRSARTPLPGTLLNTRISAGEGWFALGLATDDPVKFQGFHAENLLIIFDEASGIPDPIWDAAEGVAVGRHNRILAIGNPLTTSGRFYKLFRSGSAWRRETISALEHPNVTGEEPPIPGAVTPEAISERVAEWCQEEVVGSLGDGVVGDGASVMPGAFVWQGRRYKPNNLFKARVLGEFPDSEDDTLIPLPWIEAAVERELPPLSTEGCKRVAADVARFGSDCTVIGMRIGPRVVRMDVVRGADLMEVAGRIMKLAYEEHPDSIAVDAIGLGAGVVDRLVELNLGEVEAVNVANTANNSQRFANRRAELYWSLRERFRIGNISIPRDDALVEELSGLRYLHTSRGQIRMESKEDMKRRGMHSPDRADMLAMLFDSSAEVLAAIHPGRAARTEDSPSAQFRSEMNGW